MNGIRLAIFAMAAISFSQVDLSEATAQDFRGGPPQEAGDQSAQEQAKRARDRAFSDSEEQESNEGRSTRTRRGSSSQSNDGSNAIKSNPLFQLFDENGDGELSLEEIDAASRLLYSLDANQDDRITANEVEDMGVTGAGANDQPAAATDRDRRGGDRASTRGGNASQGSMRGPPAGFSGAPSGIDRNAKTPPRRSSSASQSKRDRMERSFSGGARGTSSASDNDFAANDRDKDGVLKRGELPSKMRSDFRKMDADGNGEVNENEFYDFIDGKN